MPHSHAHTPTPAPATGLAALSPAYFGMVMATGIVSLAASMRGLDAVAVVLLALNMVMYGTLWTLYVARALRSRDAMLADLRDHLRGDLSPPYWINMGAMAISTLAGSLLILNAPDAPFLTSVLPFLKGFTIFYWATGTWWIPMLVVLAFWRYAVKRFALRYDPLYWGAVFPLGMYAACTHELALAMQLDFLAPIPGLFLAIALLAWCMAFVGVARRVLTLLRPR